MPVHLDCLYIGKVGIGGQLIASTLENDIAPSSTFVPLPGAVADDIALPTWLSSVNNVETDTEASQEGPLTLSSPLVTSNQCGLYRQSSKTLKKAKAAKNIQASSSSALHSADTSLFQHFGMTVFASTEKAGEHKERLNRNEVAIAHALGHLESQIDSVSDDVKNPDPWHLCIIAKTN